MDNQHYLAPIQFGQLIKGELMKRCSLQESIQQQLKLVITTRFHEVRYDPGFGCEIWEVDFVVPTNLNTWKDEIRQSLEEAILSHEPRIGEILQLKVTVEPAGQKGRINQKLSVHLEAMIKGTYEKIIFDETLYFSPVTLL